MKANIALPPFHRSETTRFTVEADHDLTQTLGRYAKCGQVIYLRGRLRFDGAEASAPFPSAIVIFWGGRLGQATRPELQP